MSPITAVEIFKVPTRRSKTDVTADLCREFRSPTCISFRPRNEMKRSFRRTFDSSAVRFVLWRVRSITNHKEYPVRRAHAGKYQYLFDVRLFAYLALANVASHARRTSRPRMPAQDVSNTKSLTLPVRNLQYARVVMYSYNRNIEFRTRCLSRPAASSFRRTTTCAIRRSNASRV